MNDEIKRYNVNIRITDKQMKLQEMNGERTTQRLSFEQIVESFGKDEDEAVVNALLAASETWSNKKYSFKVLSVKEPLIVVPELIL